MKADYEQLSQRDRTYKNVDTGDYLTQKQYQMVAVFLGVTHFLLEFFYIFIDCMPMYIINIFSYLAYVVSIALIRRGHTFITVWIMEAEVYWHVIAGCVFMGFACGYQFWLFGVFASVFLPYSVPTLSKSQKHQIGIFGLVIVLTYFLLIFLDRQDMLPTLYRASQEISNVLIYINVGVGFASMLVYASFYNYRVASKNEELKQAANHDYLTGIYNRQRMQTILSGEVDRATTDDSTMLAVAVLDIDYFKKINDTYGHRAGDDVLKEIADIFRESEDQGLLFGRWGGEEFLLISPENISYYQFGEMLEELRKKIENHKFVSGKHTMKVTVSIGAAAYEIKMTAEKLVHAADDRLYEAKQSGRNRVIYKK